VVAVLPQHDPPLVPMKGDAVPAIDVGLPDAAPPTHPMGVKTGVPRVVAEQLDAPFDRSPQSRILAAGDADERLGDDELGRVA
jgi:hypothetical protein